VYFQCVCHYTEFQIGLLRHLTLQLLLPSKDVGGHVLLTSDKLDNMKMGDVQWHNVHNECHEMKSIIYNIYASVETRGWAERPSAR
jgi:hypothetical protein